MNVVNRHAVRSAGPRFRPACQAFTLIEILAASMAFALLLTAVYTLFSRATRLRDDATTRTQEMRLRNRAVALLRDDLRNALVSGGRMAAELKGSRQAPMSRFPGYLRFTTTTGQNRTNELFGDLQEVEYFIVEDPFATNRAGGLLVRVVDRNLLATVRVPTAEEPLLSNVQALDVAFLDGQNWIDSWEYSDTDTRLPAAVHVRIQFAPDPSRARAPRPIEIVTSWSVQAPDNGGGNGMGGGMAAVAGSSSGGRSIARLAEAATSSTGGRLR